TSSILHGLATGNEVAVAQSHFAARCEAEEFLWWVLHEVVALDVEFAAKGDRARASRRVFRIVDSIQRFSVAFRPVLDYQLQRVQHGHASERRAVEQLADRVFERRVLGNAVRLGDAAAADEVTQRGGGDATPTHTGKGRHARVVPPTDTAF